VTCLVLTDEGVEKQGREGRADTGLEKEEWVRLNPKKGGHIRGRVYGRVDTGG